jgi:hypothetical protein
LALPLVGAGGGVVRQGTAGLVGVSGSSPGNGCHCCSGVRVATVHMRVEAADSRRADTSLTLES